MSVTDTPMMQQYKEIKGNHPGFLLFYRMGDFYELFGEDALLASKILDITLTKRRTAKKEDTGIPMCGVPYHASEGYIARLLQTGHKVALCEQTESPEEARKKRGAKALVKREVVRLYTGGTLTEDSMLTAHENNYLAAFAKAGETFSFAWADLSTGEFFTQDVETASINGVLAQLSPQELLMSEHLYETHTNLFSGLKDKITELPPSFFDSQRGDEQLCATFKVKTTESLGLTSRSQLAACGSILGYIRQTQMDRLPVLQRPQAIQNNAYLLIDQATRQNLEIDRTLKGQRKGSLLHTIDHTVSAMGSRLLSRWLNTPGQDINEIRQRQQAISAYLENPQTLDELRDTLGRVSDINRSLSRITLDRGGPRDLQGLSLTIQLFSDIIKINEHLFEYTPNGLFQHMCDNLKGFNELEKTLSMALIEDTVPLLARDGGFIKSSFCEKLNEYRRVSTNGLDMLKALERREAERTGISSLRIKYNKVWGYFIEITKTHADKVPQDYVHRQTTTSTQRFSTPELMQLERDYSAAEANALHREQQIFADMVDLIKQYAEKLLLAADALAHIDVLSAGATLAERHNYCCPEMENSPVFEIEGGRHPVVEQTVETFIANTTILSNNALWLVTGPNMAGKSTFLRQNALITILAHIGYYVPAQKARIGLVDKIFTRVGAADDLSKGQSTFMVEMVETANILNNATSRSLVILDEIGRGTATYDGLSIAWACVEHLLTQNQCRGLFATHYHELTELSQTQKKLSCHHVAVKEWQGEIIFLHEVKEGASPGSYGIHVGKLAGLPPAVTQRAEEILSSLEQQKPAAHVPETQFPLFCAPAEQAATSDIEEKLLKIHLDDLTPRQAHDLLYDLKKGIEKSPEKGLVA